jgi:mannose-6-phosphate isomerase-like protein (cupin superfamily)
MAVVLEGGCFVSNMREGTPVVNGTLSRRDIIGKHNGAQAISLSILEYSRGASPGLHTSDSDHILFRLETSESESACTVLIDGSSNVVEPDTGVYVSPGQTMVVSNDDPDAVVFVSTRCPESSALRVVDVSEIANTALEGPKRTIRLADRRPLSTADRWYRVLVDEELGSRQATQFVGSIPPGRAPDHFHHYEEVLFILKGEGRMWAGQTNTLIGPGSCVYLPKGQVHCVENTGTDELRLLGVFYPAGSPAVRYET